MNEAHTGNMIWVVTCPVDDYMLVMYEVDRSGRQAFGNFITQSGKF